ncbi:MAG: Rrf2 family transcriptional regulator [Acidimicrobiia bacterium]|nr:Rrf2 family transcriptional regulator [Acidimicrobiia bacterium]
MRLSEGVEWTVHCCTLLAAIPPDVCLPGSRLAEYHGVPGPYLTKHLQSLTRAGILESVSGPKGGFRLARPARDITMLDVVEAIDGPTPAFTCTEIRRRGPAGGLPARHYPTPCGIHVVMDRADAAWRAELAATSIHDLAVHVAGAISPQTAEKAAAWFQAVTIRGRKGS